MGEGGIGGCIMGTMERKELGKYIVADPEICHGTPTFKGSRVMVWQVLEMVADRRPWETIAAQWPGSVSLDAIEEAVRLAGKAFEDHAIEYGSEAVAG